MKTGYLRQRQFHRPQRCGGTPLTLRCERDARARQALQALLAQEGTAERAADTAFRRAAQLREMVGATTPVAGAALWAALSTSNFDVGRSSRDPEHSGRVQGWRIYGFWATLDWQTRIPRRSPALVHRNARFFGGIAFVVAVHAQNPCMHRF